MIMIIKYLFFSITLESYILFFFNIINIIAPIQSWTCQIVEKKNYQAKETHVEFLSINEHESNVFSIDCSNII
jgi:hypothetical protein